MTPALHLKDARQAAVARAVERASGHLLTLQHSNGSWCADLTADSTLESDYILLQLWLHPPKGGVWNPPARPLIDKAVRSILARQLPDGGFNIYAKGPSEISATVKAYFALKLAGLALEDPRLARARERIFALGGLQAANSYVKVNLSLFGLYPREHAPAIPPELILLGNVIYEMSSWTRAIVVALSVAHSARDPRPVPDGFNLEEIHLPGVSFALPRSPQMLSWRNAFLALNSALKLWEKYGPRFIRRRALRKAEQWMIDRFEASDGLGAIYPPMMYAIMALDVLGYSESHPLRIEALRQFENLLTDDGDRFYFQPCFSPVWDTAIAQYALSEAGADPAPLTRSADWLLAREIRRIGDWSVKRPHTEPSGWAFEYNNEFYPDIDDTAMVLLALSRASASNADRRRACIKRAVDWLRAMQSRDGGWAAFDVDNNWHILSHVPFADHNAMLDPTCADITGRVLEAFGAHGLDRSHPAVQRGIHFLVRTQQADGSWYGRWGVAYIYGTCFALRGLRAAGEDDREVHVLRAGEWLRSIQNADGGWGEICASYDNNAYTNAPSTPSQTAWAVMGLLAGGDTTSESVRRGVDWLLHAQKSGGSWDEELATGTGFPRVFYLNYHYYRLYFPLLALGEFQKVKDESHLDRL
ncbi:MAG: squalene--hopene cyclase [Bryobacteraceae bacterium]